MSGQDLQTKMAALKADYAARLPAKVGEIQETWQELQQEWSEETLRSLRLKTHTLRGGALSFGFPLLGERAGVLEDQLLVLSQERLPNHRQKEDIVELIESLVAALPGAEREIRPPPPADPVENKGLIYLLDEDDDLISTLSGKLRQRGFDTHRVADPGELPEIIRQRPPAALFIDLSFNDGQQSGAQVLFQLRKVYQQNLPVVFVSNRDDMAARIAATRAGGRAFFTRPVPIQAVVEALARVTLPRPVRSYRVLIVDEKGSIGSRYLDILKEAGMQCRLLRQPLHFMRVWGEYLPTLALVSSHQSSVGTPDLLATLRQQDRFHRLPILVFADGVDPTLEAVVQEGLADGLLWADASPEVLINTIVSHTENSERLINHGQSFSTRDPLTHCLNRQGLMARLDQEEHRAHSPTPLAVLAIRLQNYREIDRAFGFDTGDRLLREVASLLYRKLEASDTLARFSDGTFVVLSIQRLLPAVNHLADGLRRALEQFRLDDLGNPPMQIACAIGIGVFDRSTPTPRQALINALSSSDSPHARNEGVELHHSTEALRLAEQRHEEWRTRLTEALAEQRLFLTFQPIASLHGEPHHYYDVFVRMPGDVPEETVPAAEFMAVAEQSGLVGEVDRWVLQQAAGILAARIREGDRQASLFLRLSGQSLNDEDFINWLRHQLDEHDLPGESLNLTLAVTEIDRQFKSLQQFTGRVRAMDCRVGIAEVNNNPRVFQALKRLPVSFIKIQTNIIRARRRERDAVRQLRAICHRAHDQQLTVIAPCVEDAESLNILWSNGVDYIEGFFIHPPELSLNYDFGES